MPTKKIAVIKQRISAMEHKLTIAELETIYELIETVSETMAVYMGDPAWDKLDIALTDVNDFVARKIIELENG